MGQRPLVSTPFVVFPKDENETVTLWATQVRLNVEVVVVFDIVVAPPDKFCFAVPAIHGFLL